MNDSAHDARGMLFIHSAPTALRSHIEWAVAAAVRLPSGVDWQRQPVEPGSWCLAAEWHGDRAQAAGLVSTLSTWGRLRLELSVDPPAQGHGEGLGHRWSVTPSLGVFSADTSAIGDVMVSENRLRLAMAEARREGTDLQAELSDLLGEPWDVELEPYRARDPELDVSWLSSQVG